LVFGNAIPIKPQNIPQHNTSIAISCTATSPQQQLFAQELSARLHLPIENNNKEHYDYWLTVTETHLELQQTNSKHKPLFVDFLSPGANYRRLKGGGAGQLIARALGLKKHPALTVIDATAGLGADSFVLASLGCKVHCLERSPIIAALLEDGLRRLQQHPDFQQMSLTLTITDALSYLQSLSPAQYPDVIYLDPMFPERKKTALVKKEMRILRDLVDEDNDTEVLLAMALKCAKKRVVVKRPRIAVTIGATKPNLIYTGQSCRFDVYLNTGILHVYHP